jgi:uncharacterized membrane protein (UPF0127 family)
VFCLDISNKTRELKYPLKLEVCSSFFQKLQGLMFRKTLAPEEGILLVENTDSVISSSIHMFFMNFDLGIVWLNGNLEVVDRAIAKKWQPYYASKLPARYTLEIHPTRLMEFEPGDQIAFNHED